ncbi:MAG: family N-acetyltransferase [Herbinix sp.]|nr:family N-acetyltransferase [Herbinix sp.]
MNETEQNSDNSPWVANWPLFLRIMKFGDGDFLQTIIETKDGHPVGFIIFRDMLNKSTQIELKRIAVNEKGKGYGKEALLLSQRLAFEIYKTKKLYLHTKIENIRAQNIYKHVGFIAETPDPCTSFYLDETDYEMMTQSKHRGLY